MSLGTTIENLSNELFLEIFEYLDGCEIYQAFSNLNYWFEQLINSSSLLLKFNINCLTSNTNIYQQLLLNNKHQIFSFYITFSLQESEFSFDHLESLIIIEIQFSSIEHLSIDHTCAFNELSTLISYVPQLRRLKFLYEPNDDINIEIIQSMTLSNLTHLCVHVHDISFDDPEIFINKLNAKKLKVLALGHALEDIDYLNANRWENFILNNLPELEKFYFAYNRYYGYNEEPPMYLLKRDAFNSLFWLQRQWILETELQFAVNTYSICPYKKRWYDYDIQHLMINQSVRLIITDECPEIYYKTLPINHILTVTKIYHLEIQERISIENLIDILYLLPELNTLRIHSLSFPQLDHLSDEELDNIVVLLNKNQITKLYLEKRVGMEELHLLILAFPRMNYLQIECIDYKYAKFLVTFISKLTKNKPNNLIRLLCLSIIAADDSMVKKLEHIIIVENLLSGFTIKRVLDKIYIHWK